jgi:hypothetical protein
LRPRIEEYQLLAPDLFLPCARSHNLRGFYEDAGDLGVAEVLAGMTDRVPPIGAPR